MYGSPLSRGRQRSVCRAPCAISLIQISNSHAASFPRRRASWAFSLSPLFEGRWSAEKRALVVQKAPFGRSIAGFMAKGPFFRRLGCLAARRFPAAACPRPANFSGGAPYWARTGTLSLRVCACEAQPRTPHPTGLGYPAPAKLSLCPTSVTPLEAPLTGQDPSRIREVLGTGIRNL